MVQVLSRAATPEAPSVDIRSCAQDHAAVMATGAFGAAHAWPAQPWFLRVLRSKYNSKGTAAKFEKDLQAGGMQPCEILARYLRMLRNCLQHEEFSGDVLQPSPQGVPLPFFVDDIDLVHSCPLGSPPGRIMGLVGAIMNRYFATRQNPPDSSNGAVTGAAGGPSGAGSGMAPGSSTGSSTGTSSNSSSSNSSSSNSSNGGSISSPTSGSNMTSVGGGGGGNNSGSAGSLAGSANNVVVLIPSSSTTSPEHKPREDASQRQGQVLGRQEYTPVGAQTRVVFSWD